MDAITVRLSQQQFDVIMAILEEKIEDAENIAVHRALEALAEVFEEAERLS